MAKKQKQLSMIVVRSDDMNKNQLKSIRKQMKKLLPKQKIAVFGVSANSSVDLLTINAKR